ncbi:chemotaxis protein CheW [Bacillus sp. JJ1521]|uniref:chemotaxis protein CheW n=1 Tax=Bacillus sp. JJ1521 TaxID=3122957 RepID=UPI0030009516
MDAQKKVIVFRLDDQEYATVIQNVRSIERMQEITRIPNVPNFIKGVINIRGEVTPIIDLKERLSIGKMNETNETRILIVEMNGIQTGLIVDAATDVIDIDASVVEPATNIMNGVNELFIEGVAKLENRLLLLLNLERVLIKQEINELQELNQL